MAGRLRRTAQSSRRSSAALLYLFDHPYLEKYSLVAGVDEAGRGPLAGPVVAAAVILPPDVDLPLLNDSKLLSSAQRVKVYRDIQAKALSMGVSIVEPAEIDEYNILQATYRAMRRALSQLLTSPAFVLVDGYPIPKNVFPQKGVLGGDRKSACVAAASVVAKVTRDRLMEAWDREYPAYGFKKHKGYGTRAHQEALTQWGPSPIHRRSFAPVRNALLNKSSS